VNAVTLLDVIDKTISPMGGRLLKRWLALPLKNVEKIKRRHQVISHLTQEDDTLQKLQQNIKHMGDLERLISKVATGKINPKEVVQLKNSLEAIVPIKLMTSQSKNDALQLISDQLNPCDLLRSKIKEMLNEEAPVQIPKGKTIADGYSSELDELRDLAFSGKDYLNKMLERETERTGITSLKIASNNVFGYYIEVRNTHKDKVPEEWIRKQTLVNAERYITEELKESQLIVWMQEYIAPVQNNAYQIAQLDCLCGFTQLAKENNYAEPIINDSTSLEITNGRHPVIEKQLPLGEAYIANDVILNREQQQIIMITGPNMSGKSAILRQTALIVLLAQMGSFVPADAAKIGYVDKIFTRVGASDNISMGESTFMVEGISIAWAISEFLHEHPARAKTLFATHYHELNEMNSTFERIKNFNVSVKELKDNVLFLRKLTPGGSEHSFGIHVAKMAGMPQQVIKKANKILKKLEKSHSNEELTDKLQEAQDEMQLSFFNLDDPLLVEVKEEIIDLDINTLTPVEALMKLNEIKRLLTKTKKATS